MTHGKCRRQLALIWHLSPGGVIGALRRPTAPTRIFLHERRMRRPRRIYGGEILLRSDLCHGGSVCASKPHASSRSETPPLGPHDPPEPAPQAGRLAPGTQSDGCAPSVRQVRIAKTTDAESSGVVTMGKRQEMPSASRCKRRCSKPAPFTINCIATTSNAPTMKIWARAFAVAHRAGPSIRPYGEEFTTTPRIDGSTELTIGAAPASCPDCVSQRYSAKEKRRLAAGASPRA